MFKPHPQIPAGQEIVTTAIAQTDSREPAEVKVLVVRHGVGAIHIYEVTESELEVLERSSFYRTLSTTGIGIGASAAVSFGLCLWTVPIANPFTYASFLALLIVSTFIFVVSNILWWVVERRITVERKKIRGTRK
jgi:hypothetical protein